MSKHFAIELKGVSKKYCKNLRKSMLYSISDIAHNMLHLSSHSERLRDNEFWSLKDVSLAIETGQVAGLIGPNGSGKTTLLKLIDGIFWPDTGEIRTRGTLGALISVGAGFHPMLSGRENIFLNGAILGLSKCEIQKKFDQIMAFSEIEQFLDMPVKNYSSGMFVRLGLAIAVHCRPDILLVDEVLSLGDQLFRNKCVKKIIELKNTGTTVILVAHNFDLIQMLCDNVYVLHEGSLIFAGETNQAIAQYSALMADLRSSRHPAAFCLHFDPTQTFSDDISVVKIGLLNDQNATIDQMGEGEDITVLYTIQLNREVCQPRFSASIGNDMLKNIIWQTNLEQKIEFGNIGPGTYELKVKFVKPSLSPGVYETVLGVYDTEKGENMLNHRLQSSQFRVTGHIPLRGIIKCSSEWLLKKK